MPQRPGRPSRLTPEIQASIVRAVTAGVPLTQAAQLVGIGHSTVLEWMARGEGRFARRAQAPYTEFADAVTRAKAIDEARRIARLEAAGRGGQILHEKVTTHADGRQVVERTFSPPDWKADAWHLQHAYAERWGWKARLEVDLQARILQVAEDVGRELGLSPDDILAEAQRYLKESDHRRRR